MRRETEKRGVIKPMVHLIVGEGKGKTTAALGMGMRGAGRGLCVVMIQFLKESNTGELAAAEQIEGFSVLRFQKGNKGFTWQMEAAERKLLEEETKEAIAYAERLLEAGGCEMLILDEVLDCLSLGLIGEETLLKLIKRRKAELILTGRKGTDNLEKYADYISEISMIKHPFNQGEKPRCGIEF